LHPGQGVERVPVGRAATLARGLAYGRLSKLQQADRAIREAKLHAAEMATAEGGPAGTRLAIAERLIRLSHPELGRQRPDTKPGHDQGTQRKGGRIETAQRLAKHERVARAIRDCTEL